MKPKTIVVIAKNLTPAIWSVTESVATAIVAGVVAEEVAVVNVEAVVDAADVVEETEEASAMIVGIVGSPEFPQ